MPPVFFFSIHYPRLKKIKTDKIKNTPNLTVRSVLFTVSIFPDKNFLYLNIFNQLLYYGLIRFQLLRDLSRRFSSPAAALALCASPDRIQIYSLSSHLLYALLLSPQIFKSSAFNSSLHSSSLKVYRSDSFNISLSGRSSSPL